MPSYTAYEIYGMGSRHKPTVENFLGTYVDLATLWEKDSHRILMKSQVGENARPWVSMDLPDFQSVLNLGLEQNRVFTVYMPPRDIRFLRVTLAFCEDNHIVFGVSMDYETEMSAVKSELMALVGNFDCQLSLVAVERAPPLSEDTFRAAGAEKWVLYFWERPV